MGQEVQGSTFTKEQFVEFKQMMLNELKLLKEIESRDEFSKKASMIGLEIEGWLVNSNMLPFECAPEFLETLGHKQVVPEISKFNFEINSNPYDYRGNCFETLKDELDLIWKKIEASSSIHECKPILIGTLPTLRSHMLTLDIMSPLNRYRVMNDQVMKLRNNKPLKIHIEGKEELDLSMNSVISECAATSLQIHLGVNLQNSAKYYNASLIASAFLLATSANSPYLFGKELWDESRILSFEQSVELDCESTISHETLSRVTFGSGFLNTSIIDLFEESVRDYPILVPEVFKGDLKNFDNIKFHNGTIWRWTRPVLGLDGEKPALRIEQRVPSSGPTLVDSIANTAFFLGLTDYLALCSNKLEDYISFSDAKNNFYKAAKQSFYCQVTWIDGKDYDMQKLLLEKIIPNVKEALLKRGIDKKSIEYYIGDIIYNRCKKAVNGAIWQKAYIHMHGKRFQEMVEEYSINQKKNIPVHLWGIDK